MLEQNLDLDKRLELDDENTVKMIQRERVLQEHIRVFTEAIKERKNKLKNIRKEIKRLGGGSSQHTIWKLVESNPGLKPPQLLIKQENPYYDIRILRSILYHMTSYGYIEKVDGRYTVKEEPPRREYANQERGNTKLLLEFIKNNPGCSYRDIHNENSKWVSLLPSILKDKVTREGEVGYYRYYIVE